MLDAGEVRKGTTIELDGEIYRVIEYHHIKLGRGSAQVRLKLKGISVNQVIERVFQASERFTPARLERRPMQFLYQDGDLYYFMDTENYDQITLDRERIEDILPFLKEGMKVEVLTHKGNPVGIELPVAVELKVVEAAPAFKGDTATAGTKPAKLETGYSIQVPYFIEAGDIIKVDTRTGEYLERVS